MSIRTWDYKCSCGKLYRDWPFEGRTPESIPCECGRRATWTRMVMNHIHETHTKLKYGEFDPQYGCVVESYSHKKQLQRQMGLVDVGKFTEEQIREQKWEAEERHKERKKNELPVMAADSLDEINAQIAKQSSRVRKGEMQESWVQL